MEKKNLKIILTTVVITLAVIGGIMIPAHLHSGRYADASADEQMQALSPVPAITVKDQKQELLTDKQETANPPSTDAMAALPNNNGHDPKPVGETEPHIVSRENEPDYDWVEARIRKHRNEIHDDDLEDFRLIMNKLDMGHINAIVNGEIPDDVEELLREYLLSQLDAREYERSKTLFMLYNHLMYEE